MVQKGSGRTTLPHHAAMKERSERHIIASASAILEFHLAETEGEAEREETGIVAISLKPRGIGVEREDVVALGIEDIMSHKEDGQHTVAEVGREAEIGIKRVGILTEETESGGVVRDIGEDIEHLPEFGPHIEACSEVPLILIEPFARAVLELKVVVESAELKPDVEERGRLVGDVDVETAIAAAADVDRLSKRHDAAESIGVAHIGEGAMLIESGLIEQLSAHRAEAREILGPVGSEMMGAGGKEVGVALGIGVEGEDRCAVEVADRGVGAAEGVGEREVVHRGGAVGEVERGDKVEEIAVIGGRLVVQVGDKVIFI